MERRARPRRSVLYMPGSNGRALEKAKTLAADGLIFDLEDAVAPDAKAAARQQVCAAVRTGGYGRRELIVRVNGLATPWARTIMAAHAQAVAAGRGVVLVEGRLIEKLHVEEARRVVALADAIAEAG